MIEIKAKLTRPPVYFANELITCLITFTNRSTSDSDVEQLAWCSVQLHCHLTVDEQKVRLPNRIGSTLTEDRICVPGRDTSFNPCKGERGQLIFSSVPRILFCDLRMQSNQTETFSFNECIPTDSPPSFNGMALKYIYKITIGTQRLNSVIQFLKMPLKVLTFPADQVSSQSKKNSDFNNSVNGDSGTVGLFNGGNSHSSSHNSAFNACNGLDKEENEDVFESSHSQIVAGAGAAGQSGNKQECKESVLDVLMHRIDSLSAKRFPNTYVITNPNGKVAKFWILKSTFKLGEDVIGVFDFGEAEIPCVQFSVTLQSEEQISDEYKVKSKSLPFISNYSKYEEFCFHTSNTQIILPIPLTITPTFQTDIVNLSWKLHFEFVTAKPDDVDSIQIADSQGVQFQCPKSLNVQTMVWDLPITILPTHPIQIGRGLQMPATSFVMI